MLNPTDWAPASQAPRLAASIMPGPPPVTMTMRLRCPFCAGLADDAAEFARHIVIVALGENTFGDRRDAQAAFLSWLRASFVRLSNLASRHRPVRRCACCRRPRSCFQSRAPSSSSSAFS